jgi:CheY-like chemotaxis protein
LIVDDEAGLLRLFAGLVERLNCQTLRACGGEAAIDILSSATPDLLILDLAMPGISGIDVLNFVRGTPRLDDMKVMILTARPNMIPELGTLGFDYWVSKPIMPQDFLEVVQSALEAMPDR